MTEQPTSLDYKRGYLAGMEHFLYTFLHQREELGKSTRAVIDGLFKLLQKQERYVKEAEAELELADQDNPDREEQVDA